MSAIWLAAAFALLPPLVVAIVAAGRAREAQRLIAVQAASSLGLMLLVAFTFAFDQPAAIDLALAFALLTLPATLLFALFEERWL